ncbi:carotenoid ester lipase precursor [Mycena polygramma]|nr:carotenoid ester lipase precursor [Mycena polygramma]
MAPVFSVGLLVALLARAHAAAGSFIPPRPGLTVCLDNQTFTGVAQSRKTESFLGIPFALPPVGDLRFHLPVPVPRYSRPYSVAGPAIACPQQRIVSPIQLGPLVLLDEAAKLISKTVFETFTPSQEDCLTINVIKPATATPTSKLPVVVWIFGGGFEMGSSTPGESQIDGPLVVERSITVGQEVIWVAMNYRVSAFGFLAGKEVRAAGVGNLGLHDQREALRWVQKYIQEFGGDPNQVTLWGESAGAISISLHMLAFGGTTDGLFHGAIMQSGAPIPVGPLENGQKYYDDIVRKTGCSKFSDTLACLRTVDYAVLKKAQDESPFIFSPQSLVLAWLPREDGVFLIDNPQRLVEQGRIAHIPIISGSVDDEGTLFSFSTLDVKQVSEYINRVYIPGASPQDLKQINELYPSAFTLPCLGLLHPISRQFKRLAGFQGDIVFQAPRRFFQQHLPSTQKQWSFLHKRLDDTPCLGAFHSSDILKVVNSDLVDYVINFVQTFDPNNGASLGLKLWPQYSKEVPEMLTFQPIGRFGTITNDTYRAEGMKLLTDLSLVFPL